MTPSPRATLIAALLGFFVITLDAVVVNVALPAMDRELAAGMAGLQWVVDGYTLMFAALLLSAGALCDRIGARRAFGGGLIAFVAASRSATFETGLRASLLLASLVSLATAAASLQLSAPQRGPALA